MRKDAVIFLEDILKNIELIERFVKNKNRKSFRADTKTQYSVIRGIEIIGEATKNLPRNLTDKYFDIPWKDIAGMRDKLIHAYFGVNLDRVWIVVENELPDLKKKIKKILKEIEEKEEKDLKKSS